MHPTPLTTRPGRSHSGLVLFVALLSAQGPWSNVQQRSLNLIRDTTQSCFFIGCHRGGQMCCECHVFDLQHDKIIVSWWKNIKTFLSSNPKFPIFTVQDGSPQKDNSHSSEDHGVNSNTLVYSPDGSQNSEDQDQSENPNTLVYSPCAGVKVIPDDPQMPRGQYRYLPLNSKKVIQGKFFQWNKFTVKHA